MIQWEEKYKTGVKELDRQHRWLFEFVNALENQLLDNKQRPKIDHALDVLKNYAQKHFRYEEECMYRWKCRFAKENKCAHRNFVTAYNNFMERYQREGHSEELAWKIHDMAERWVLEHICQIYIHLTPGLAHKEKENEVVSAGQ